jgi:hypothetical protein
MYTALLKAVPYLKKYWPILAVVGGLYIVLLIAERVTDAYVNVQAYKHPRIKTITVVKETERIKEQRDLEIDEERTEYPDGRVVVRKITRDKTRTHQDTTSNTEEKKDQKPVLVTQRKLGHTVSYSYKPDSGTQELGYNLRWNNLSFGGSFDPSTISAYSLKASLSF